MQVVQTSVTTNNSPSQDYTIPDDQPTTNIDSPWSQPTTVLLRTTPSRTINQLQTLTHLGHNRQQSFSGLHQPGCSNNSVQTLTQLGHNQQQSFSGLHQPGQSTNYKHGLTWVTTNNSPSRDYANSGDRSTTNSDFSLYLVSYSVKDSSLMSGYLPKILMKVYNYTQGSCNTGQLM